MYSCLNFSDQIIRIQQECLKCNGNGKGTDMKMEDFTIQGAWDALDSVPPWSIEQFFKQMNEYQDEVLFQSFYIRKNFPILIIIHFPLRI